MKYHVLRDVGHRLQKLKIQNLHSSYHVCPIILRWQDIAPPIYVNYKSMTHTH